MFAFHLKRLEDETGISGTGIVAEGVQFADGTVAMRWLTEHRSTALYDSLVTLARIHCHGGKSILERTGDAQRGHSDGMMCFLLDEMENAPCASIRDQRTPWGRGERATIVRPDWASMADAAWPLFLSQYLAAALPAGYESDGMEVW